MYNVLMFVDSGVDDSFALMYALLNPKINLVGVVSGYGNITKEQSIMNTAYLLKLAGREDIPIIGGVAGPLSGEPTVYYPEIHGKEGLGPIRPPSDLKNIKIYDVDKIIQVVEQNKGNLIMVGVGRLTDLALPFIIYGTDALRNVSALYIMGGAFLVPGNVTAEAEANFYADPIAAYTVMEKGRNIYLHPLNITNRAIITPDVIDFLAENSSSPFKQLLKPAYEYYFSAYKKLVPGIKGAPLHDVVPLFALTNPGIVQYIQRRVRVEQFGNARGKSSADFRPKPDEESKESLDFIGMEADIQKFIIDFMEIFLKGSVKK